MNAESFIVGAQSTLHFVVGVYLIATVSSKRTYILDSFTRLIAFLIGIALLAGGGMSLYFFVDLPWHTWLLLVLFSTFMFASIYSQNQDLTNTQSSD